MEHFVITIGRYCGSGGASIAKKLANELQIPFYDKNLLRLASDDSGISEELFSNADETLKRSLIYRISKNVYHGELIPPESDDFTSNQNLFNYQAKVITQLARESSCIIIGRCSDFILRNEPHVLRVFICASEPSCIAHEAARSHISKKEAETRVRRFNRRRKEYYKYYTGQTWDDPRKYDLCLNTDSLSIEQCVAQIRQLLGQ